MTTSDSALSARKERQLEMLYSLPRKQRLFSQPLDIAKSHWVCVTSATQHPGTFPQRHTVTQQVATALIQQFSLTGVSGEMLTNQGTNFMSKVMKQQY